MDRQFVFIRSIIVWLEWPKHLVTHLFVCLFFLFYFHKILVHSKTPQPHDLTTAHWNFMHLLHFCCCPTLYTVCPAPHQYPPCLLVWRSVHILLLWMPGSRGFPLYFYPLPSLSGSLGWILPVAHFRHIPLSLWGLIPNEESIDAMWRHLMRADLAGKNWRWGVPVD